MGLAQPKRIATNDFNVTSTFTASYFLGWSVHQLFIEQKVYKNLAQPYRSLHHKVFDPSIYIAIKLMAMNEVTFPVFQSGYHCCHSRTHLRHKLIRRNNSCYLVLSFSTGFYSTRSCSNAGFRDVWTALAVSLPLSALFPFLKNRNHFKANTVRYL